VNHQHPIYKPNKIMFPDLNRFLALYLCAEIILTKNIVGDVAELGVYQGEFAKEINGVFPKKDLYLFDTFDGFDKAQLEKDKALFSAVKDKNFTSDEELVLTKMPYRERCFVKKGLFPSTTNDVNTDFVFVSIDADLYEPTLAGLQFFYPRLNSGGYIFIHDYNNKDWPGVKKAVDQFVSEQKINFVPITDANGTVIITK
jgi:O-methyltransferase